MKRSLRAFVLLGFEVDLLTYQLAHGVAHLGDNMLPQIIVQSFVVVQR